MFDKKTILITGGTGSFGKAFLSKLVKKNLEKLEFLVETKKNKKI